MYFSFDFIASSLALTGGVHNHRTTIGTLSIEVIGPLSECSSYLGRAVSNQWIVPSSHHQIIAYEHQLKLALLKYSNVWGEFTVDLSNSIEHVRVHQFLL